VTEVAHRDATTDLSAHRSTWWRRHHGLLSDANELDGLCGEIRLRGAVGCRPRFGVAGSTRGRAGPPGLIGARRSGERKPQQRFYVKEGQDDRARVAAFQIGVERRVLQRNIRGVGPRHESEGGGADFRLPPRGQVAKMPLHTRLAFAIRAARRAGFRTYRESLSVTKCS